jgi:O-antigen/teichoic acid export membrane protein
MNYKELQEKFQKALKNKDVSYVLKGSALTAISMIMVQVLRMGGGVIIGRYYGPEVNGQLRALTVLVTSVIILANFGLKDAMLRLIPEYRERDSIRTSWNIYKKGVSFLFLFSLIAGVSVIWIAPWFSVYFKVPELKGIFVLSAFFIFPLMLNEFNGFTLRALFKVKMANLANLITISIRLVALIVVTFLFFNVYNPLYIYLFIMCGVAALVSTYMIYKHLYIPSRQHAATVHVKSSQLLMLSFPMLLTYASFLINDKSDSLMILRMLGEDGARQLGIYAVCISFADLGRMGMQAMNVTIQPKMSQMFHSGRVSEIKNVATKASKTFALLNIPVTLVLVFGGSILLSIYGKEFTPGASALAALAVGQMFNTFAGPTAQLLNVTGHHKQFMVIAFFGAVVNIIFNIFMIPAYGIMGAAVASAISMITWNFVASIYIYKKFGFFIGYIPFVSEKFLNK